MLLYFSGTTFVEKAVYNGLPAFGFYGMVYRLAFTMDKFSIVLHLLYLV